ncbi:MAG: phosphoribulokinase [Actinomycetota bacterium]|nr:phosphoribulokinase [Actinomycetota bacterium]
MPDKQMTIQRASSDQGSGPQRPIMLAIAGDSASGKTTLTKGLVKALGPERITSMCVDDFHRYDRKERKELPFTPLHPDCNHLDIMEQHLQLLSRGEPILKPVYNHSTGELERPVKVEPREFIVVEGLFPLWSRLSRACFDATVYLDPPESVRRAWKVARDTSQRGYTEDQVLADLEKREPESEAFIRPQRRWADIVVRFSPIEERGESTDDPLSATVLLRPTIPHPDLLSLVGEETSEAMHLKLLRDEDGKPVDALHIHSYAPEEATRKVEEAIWSQLDVSEPLSEELGMIDGKRDGPLAITQLILLYHLVQAERRAAA